MRKLFWLLLLIPAMAMADNFITSGPGTIGRVTFTNPDGGCDSARIYLGYPDSSNFYCTYKLTPCYSGDKTILMGGPVVLDSIGWHQFKVVYYETGASAPSGYVAGAWLTSVVTATFDSSLVGRAVHFAPTTPYGDSSGTMGKALVDAASCNPSGSNTVVITTKRTTDSTVIIGARVQANLGTGGIYYLGYTNNEGQVGFSCDDDTLLVYLRAERISFTSPESLFITGNTSVTYYGTPFTPTSPPVDSVCIVYGYVLNKDGTGYVGARAEIWMEMSPATYHGSLVDVGKISVARTDTSGLFEFSAGVIPTGLFDQDDLMYTLRISTKTWIWEGKIEVPTAASYEVDIPPY